MEEEEEESEYELSEGDDYSSVCIKNVKIMY